MDADKGIHVYSLAELDVWLSQTVVEGQGSAPVRFVLAKLERIDTAAPVDRQLARLHMAKHIEGLVVQ